MIRLINASRINHGLFIYLPFCALIVINLSFSVAAQPRLSVDKLIPRSALFADEDKLNVRLSPDGKTIVHITPSANGDQVFATSVADPESSRLLFRQNDGPLGNLQWTYSSRQLIFLKAVGQDVHLFVFNLADRQIRDLTPQTGVSARVEKLSPEHPEEVLIGLKKTEARRFDLYRLNLQTGDSTVVLKNDSYDSFICDDEFRPRVAIRRTDDQGYDLFSLKTSGRWELLDRFNYEEGRISQPSALKRKERHFISSTIVTLIKPSLNRLISILVRLALSPQIRSLISEARFFFTHVQDKCNQRLQFTDGFVAIFLTCQSKKTFST
jgi:hypothetical protein